MATVERFEDLKVWQASRFVCQLIHSHVLKNESNQDFELKNQINRSSASVMDNIAEGFGRGGNKEFNNFLSIAQGSNDEVKSQLYRCLDREIIDRNQFNNIYEKVDEVGKMIGGFMKYLKSSGYKGTKFKIDEPVVSYSSN